MNIVFSVLELLDYFSDQNDNELGDSIEVALAQLLAGIYLTVESVEANIYETFDLKFTKEVAQRPVLLWHT